MADDFFTPIENDQPFLKLGAQGFAGSGKTFTLALIAAGLHKRIGSKKPIAIFDTERSSKFLRAFFAEQGIKVIVKKSRSLKDLSETIARCEAGASDILMIDSASHVWENWIDEYKVSKRITDIQFQHWGQIKPAWKKRFSDPFVTSAVHILMTGRAAFTYGKETNEDTGKKELVTTGVKMRVEGETAYEPDLLIEMQRVETMAHDGGRRVWREAVVLKDRSRLLDGKTLGPNPDYKSFEPLIEYLLSDVVPARPDTQSSDADLVEEQDQTDRTKTDRKVLLEEIEAMMKAAAPSRSDADAKWRFESMQECFGTGSWTKVGMLNVATLRKGLERLGGRAHARKTKGESSEEGGNQEAAGSGEASG